MVLPEFDLGITFFSMAIIIERGEGVSEKSTLYKYSCEYGENYGGPLTNLTSIIPVNNRY